MWNNTFVVSRAQHDQYISPVTGGLVLYPRRAHRNVAYWTGRATTRIIVEGMSCNTKASQLLHLVKGPRSPTPSLGRRMPILHVGVGTLSANVSSQWPPWLLDNCFISERPLKSVRKSDQSCNIFLVTSGRSKFRGLSWPPKSLLCLSSHLGHIV